MVSIDPTYGYHANAFKTWLITKDHHKSAAIITFQDTNVNITFEGKPHLVAAMVTKMYIEQYVGCTEGQSSKEAILHRKKNQTYVAEMQRKSEYILHTVDG